MSKNRFMFYFFIYTVVTFIVGIVMKITLVGWQIDILQKISNSSFIPQRSIIEAASGMATQVVLVIATLITYPSSIIKLFKMIRNSEEQWNQKNQKRFFIEYLVFLIAFIIFDLAGITIITIENAPMTGWILFSIISIFFPTSFAVGSLLFLRKSKQFVEK